MLERLHEHINQQLQANTRTDTIFVVTAVIFDFVMLGINSSVAAGARGGNGSVTALVVLVITLIFSILVNGIAVLGLVTGRQTRGKLIQGLLKMYEDAGVRKYYDESLLADYNRRYLIFTGIIGLLGLVAVVIPLVILWIR
jgi:hypothetical protein